MSNPPSPRPQLQPIELAAAAANDPKHAEAFGALGDLELEFERAEVEILKFQIAQTSPLYARRNVLTSAIPSFWPTVLDATPDFDSHIAPQDMDAMSTITAITVTRPNPGREPRDFIIEFAFDPAGNQWFSDLTLKKQFWWRSSGGDGWSGLVSEPVEIHWKKDRDLTAGETSAVYAAWKLRKSQKESKGKGAAPNSDADSKKKSLEERLKGGQPSFFTWFAWIGRGREGDLDKEDEEEDLFNHGDEVALTLADDVYPNAIKYFLEALTGGEDSDANDEISDDEEEEDEDEEDGEEDGSDEGEEEEEEEDSEAEVGGSSSRVKRRSVTSSDDEEADEGSMRRKRVKK
ncbi:hypothetical protein TWF696_003813 [Orbilia brochopaga]|uniref:Nucleosome assembly protein n=1 Tax=Orbilia brochopaga TaxID=3140254 RepID=A0AAV9V7Y3_9PEZI